MENGKPLQTFGLAREQLPWGKETRFTLRITHSTLNFDQNNFLVRVITKNSNTQHRITTGLNADVAQARIACDDFPLFLSVTPSDNAFGPGQLFVTVMLEIDGNEALHLCSGFVSLGKGISFPNTQSIDPTRNHGRIQQMSSANPAANTEATLTVGVSELWLVHSLSITLVTDANAANRRVHFVFTGPSGNAIDTFSDIDHTASLSRKYSVAQFGAIPDSTDDNDILVPMPAGIWIGPEGDIKTQTLNRQAGDDFGALTATVERFPAINT